MDDKFISYILDFELAIYPNYSPKFSENVSSVLQILMSVTSLFIL